MSSHRRVVSHLLEHAHAMGGSPVVTSSGQSVRRSTSSKPHVTTSGRGRVMQSGGAQHPVVRAFLTQHIATASGVSGPRDFSSAICLKASALVSKLESSCMQVSCILGRTVMNGRYHDRHMIMSRSCVSSLLISLMLFLYEFLASLVCGAWREYSALRCSWEVSEIVVFAGRSCSMRFRFHFS